MTLAACFVRLIKLYRDFLKSALFTNPRTQTDYTTKTLFYGVNRNEWVFFAAAEILDACVPADLSIQ